MTVTNCMDCHRDIDVTHFIKMLYKHNVTIATSVAIAIISKKPLPPGQVNMMSYRAAKNLLDEPFITGDKSRCKLCLQEYAICWNCGRYAREIDFIKKVNYYNGIIKRYDPKFNTPPTTMEGANNQISKKSPETVNKANRNKNIILEMENNRWVEPIRYHCYNCFQ